MPFVLQIKLAPVAIMHNFLTKGTLSHYFGWSNLLTPKLCFALHMAHSTFVEILMHMAVAL